MDSGNPHIIPISLGFVKVFLLKGDALILVDAGYPGSERRILKKLSGLGIEPGDISAILITHGHTDHFGGAAALKEATGAKIIAHSFDADNIQKGLNGPVVPATGLGRFLMPLVRTVTTGKISSSPIQPDVLVDGDTDLGEFGVDGRILWTPGHTAGSLSVLLPGGAAIVGDLMMGFPSMRRPGYPLWATSRSQVVSSVEKVLAALPSRIHAAHGGPFAPRAVAERFGLG